MPASMMPPSVSGRPPMGASPVGVPSGAPGQSANALAKVREAIKILEAALPALPTGSDPYKSVLSAIQSISKHVSPSDEIPGVQQTALRDIGQQSSQNAMLQQLMRSMGSASPGGAPGGGASPPGAPPAPMA